MVQWNDTTRAVGPGYGLPDNVVTDDELAAALADIDACKPLNEEELDELFPINTDNNE